MVASSISLHGVQPLPDAELKRTIKAAEDEEDEDGIEAAEAMARKLRPSIVKQIEAQMVYKRQANTSRVSAEFPNLSLAQVQACGLATPWSLLYVREQGMDVIVQTSNNLVCR